MSKITIYKYKDEKDAKELNIEISTIEDILLGKEGKDFKNLKYCAIIDKFISYKFQDPFEGTIEKECYKEVPSLRSIFINDNLYKNHDTLSYNKYKSAKLSNLGNIYR